jgi:transposase
MPKKINKLKKEKVKQALLQGKSIRQALRFAGYSEGTVHGNANSNTNRLVKACMEEIMTELKAKDVTVDVVIQRLNEDRELARKKGDISTMTRVDELLGKYLAMFTDRQEIAQVESQEAQWSLERVRKLRQNNGFLS